MPRKNSSGIDWNDPAAVAAYNAEIKRRSPRHHEYNRQYSKEHYTPNGRPPSDREQASGEAHGQSKLTWQVVRWIRDAKPSMSYAKIRKQLQDAGFEIQSLNTLVSIVHNRTWKEND